VDIFYHHRPDPETPLEESIGALNDIVRSGNALYAGISNYPGALTDAACLLTGARGWSPIVVHQPRYHMLERTIEKDLVPAAKKHNFGIIVFSPLASGLLTDKYLNGIPEGSRAMEGIDALPYLRNQISDEPLVLRLRGLNEIARKRGQSLAQMALAWVLRLPEVTSALIGASRVEQIEQNVAALENLKFTDEELRQIEKLLKP